MSRLTLDVLKLPWAGMTVAAVLTLSFSTPASGQDWFDDPYYTDGAYYDDGNYTDDWYFDYYDDFYNYNYYEDYDDYGYGGYYGGGDEDYFDYEYEPEEGLYEEEWHNQSDGFGRDAGVEFEY